MRVLVFSDTHLTKDFDSKKFEFLKKIISESDQVIVNGDFWDGYIISFDEFLKSDWAGLFPLLKSKKTSYIYGNHDQKEFCDDRVKLFSVDQTDKIFFMMKDKELVIEHGNKYLPFIDERVSRDLIPRVFAQYTLDYESFLIRTFGTALINELYKKYNREIKVKIPAKLKNNEILVCGHTHLAELDLENNFVNGGLTNYGLGQYLLLENNEIVQKEFWYDAPKLEEMLEPQLYINYTKEIDPDSAK